MNEDTDLSAPIKAIVQASSKWWAENMTERIEYDWSDCSSDLCESPIEKVFLYAFCALHEQFKVNGSPQGGDARLWLVAPDGQPNFDAIVDSLNAGQYGDSVVHVDVVKAQCKIENYRGDFVIRRFLREPPQRMYVAGPKVIVECDGHDFHEKTKDQAQRDKARDRELQAQGYLVLRFTGSELWRDPMKCARQVDNLMDEHISRDIKARRKERSLSGRVP